MNQLSLFTRRKARKPPPALEVRTHIAVADALAWGLAEGWWASHIPSGEHRSAATGALLKRMGTKKGLPDFIIVGPTGFYFLELKRRPNGLTQEQKNFCDVARSARGTFAIAYDVDEAVEILTSWGCLRGITAE